MLAPATCGWAASSLGRLSVPAPCQPSSGTQADRTKATTTSGSMLSIVAIVGAHVNLEDGVLARSVLVRLLAIALAVAVGAAPGATSRAPQALRTFTDQVAELASVGRPRANRPLAGRRSPARTVQPRDFRARPAPRFARSGCRAPAWGTTRLWPSASGGREVIALKRSLLI